MPDISVIICSHNPRKDYLSRTLAALKAQTLPKERWELLLIDNASNEPLAAVWELSWHPAARHVREEKIGLTHARLRGIAESKGDLLVFVDDDNVLRADFLQVCLKISADYAWLGAWGGRCIPEFEVEPSAEIRPWIGGLVIANPTVPIWAKMRRGSEATPAGAGMVVRRRVAVHYREQVLHDPVRQTLDRSGNMLGGGGDSDMALCSCDLDLGVGQLPELELTHLIPAQRVTLKHLEGINEGIGYADVVISAIHNRSEQFPGRIQSGALRIFLLRIFMFLSGKSRAERRIRLAIERGQMRAYRDLERLGYRQRLPAQ